MRRLLLAALLGAAVPVAVPADDREYVDLPEMMRAHMLVNMRDHLAALADAQGMAAAGQWDRAAEVIETRLGMTSLESHGASHMAQFMPPAMREMGTEMHRAASRLSRLLQEADPVPVLAGFGELLERCHACHSAFRIH